MQVLQKHKETKEEIPDEREQEISLGKVTEEVTEKPISNIGSHLRDKIKDRKQEPYITSFDILESWHDHGTERCHYCDGQSLPMMQLKIHVLKNSHLNICNHCMKSMNKLMSNKKSEIDSIAELFRPLMLRQQRWESDDTAYHNLQMHERKQEQQRIKAVKRGMQIRGIALRKEEEREAAVLDPDLEI